MLVLSRQLNGVIYIGDSVVVKVTRISGNRVGLKVSAPGQMTIRRGELSGAPHVFDPDEALEAEAHAVAVCDDDSGGLVLSRKRNETIVIDDVIVITVLEIKGRNVRLGIEAPVTVPVHRKEVRERKNSGD